MAAHTSRTRRSFQHEPEYLLKVHGYWLSLINKLLKNKKLEAYNIQYDESEKITDILEELNIIYNFLHQFHTECTYLSRCMTIENNVIAKINQYLLLSKVKASTRVKLFFTLTLLGLILLDVRLSAHKAFTASKYEDYVKQIKDLYTHFNTYIEELDGKFFKDIEDLHPEIQCTDRKICIHNYCDITLRQAIDNCVDDIHVIMKSDGLDLFPSMPYSTVQTLSIEEIQAKIIEKLASIGKTVDDVRWDIPITTSGSFRFK